MQSTLMKVNARWALLAGVCLVVIVMAATWGAPVPLSDLWSHDAARVEVARRIFWELRPPRLLAGLLVGANLAASGAALQAAFRNPLAEPYLLGTSAGGALGAALALWLGTARNVAADAVTEVGNASELGLVAAAWRQIGVVSLFAFAFALIASALIYTLGARRGAAFFDRATLLLSGVALSSLLSAMMSLVVALSSRADLAQQITFWLLGGLANATPAHDVLLSLSLAVGLALMLSGARDLNALSLGDEEARALGVEVANVQKRLLLAASLMSAAAVSAAGLIGFVGLLAPHAMRKVFGQDARRAIPAAAVGGATLLCACDALARSALSPIEIPVGIVTSLLGVPLFLWLLRSNESK